MRDVDALIEETDRRRLGLQRRPASAEHRHRRAPAATARAGHRRPFTEGKEQSGVHRSSRRRTSTPRWRGAASCARGDPRCRSRCARSGRGEVTHGVQTVDTAEIERVFREEYGRAVAVLVRVFGDIDVAEEAGAGRVHRGGAALAVDRTATEPGWLDHHDRPQPGDRSPAPRGHRAPTGTPRRPRCWPRVAEPGPRRAPCTTTDSV